MDERTRPEEPANETELKRPDEAIKDLEPDEQEGEAVKGGSAHVGGGAGSGKVNMQDF